MNLTDCIEKFILLEKESINIYDNISSNSPQNISDIVKIFISEQEKHIDCLYGILDEVLCDIENINCDEYENVFLNLKVDFDILSQKNIEYKIDTEKDLFLFALQRETDLMLLCNHYKMNFSADTDGYKIFHNIADEEKRNMFNILRILHEI